MDNIDKSTSKHKGGAMKLNDVSDPPVQANTSSNASNYLKKVYHPPTKTYSLKKHRAIDRTTTRVELPEHVFAAMLRLNNVATHEDFCRVTLKHIIVSDMLQSVRQLALEAYSS